MAINNYYCTHKIAILLKATVIGCGNPINLGIFFSVRKLYENKEDVNVLFSDFI